jgi:V/A-type H+-transporting ATPase subunit I
LGLAKLSRVTVVSPRSDYAEVARLIAQFEDFHPIESETPKFDPVLQELTVKAVRLFAQADQAVKDLDLVLMPGTMDIVFRGVKIPKNEFEASTWEELLNEADSALGPIAEEVKVQKALLQKAVRSEADAQTTLNALGAVAGFSADLSRLPDLQRLKVTLAILEKDTVNEFGNSLPGAIFLTQPLSDTHSLVLVAIQSTEEAKVDRAMKALEIKPLSIPPNLPQNPAEAYKQLEKDYEAAKAEKATVEKNLNEIREKSETDLLAIRELTELAREVLDQVRVSGGLSRMAVISGYIPSKREGEFRQTFGKWIVHAEPVKTGVGHEGVPVLLENPAGLRTFQLITGQQGIPGDHEVDPTPLVSFVFPFFFGLMFADFGHGVIFTSFAFLIRQRGTGSLRQWGNIFLAAGISAMFFGILFGEFFGFSLYKFIPIPPLIEVMNTPFEGIPTVQIQNIETVMVVSILIGVAHLTTGLVLDLYDAAKAKELTEVLVGKIPTLTMYLSGVCYGVAFIGAGYSFNVLKPVSQPAPLIGIPNNLLGLVSLVVLLPSMFALFCGRAIAVKAGRITGESVGGALANGGLEVFERISQFLSNTISYVRLAIMLLVHAVLLQTVSFLTPLTNPLFAPLWIVFNILILVFEGLVVYIQDLRLHIYEFFTKFYRGTGTPFRKILPDRVRVEIKWRR